MQPQNIIVRMPNWIGDLVMATPVLTDLRNAFPKASITAMCLSPIADLLKDDEAIDELFSFKKPSNSFLAREDGRDMISKLRAGKYDLGILLTNSFSSAWWFWEGNVKRRIGYSYFPRRWFLTDALSLPEKMHQVDKYKTLLKPLGIPISRTAPRLFLEKKEIEESKQLLYQRGFKARQKLIGINPGAAYGSAKCWPPERFRELALRLLEKSDASIVFFGGAESIDLVKNICKNLPERVLNLAGVTSLRELACIIKDCDLFITNDSGPMHIAAALQRPLIALFGSTDESVTGPFGQSESVITKKVSCSPCMKRVCPIDFRCMKLISVDEVVNLAIKKFHV